MATTELTDEQFEIADRIVLVLEAAPADKRWMNPSTIARKAKVAPSHKVYPVLEWMDANVYIQGSGNGCWRKYAKRG